MANTLQDRLARLKSEMPDFPSQADLGRAAGVKGSSVSAWFSGGTKSLGKGLLPVARLLNVNPEWLNTGRGPVRPTGNASEPSYRVEEASDAYGDAHEIELTAARGSCGGGSIEWEIESREPLVKESSWFRRYSVRPNDVFAVFADGDSMSDYIVDGDIVIFDRSKQEPKSGLIFLIEHPDGLKIKKLRRDISGGWVLESLNSDKRRFPDEIVQPDQAELVRVKGQFVYRQGG